MRDPVVLPAPARGGHSQRGLDGRLGSPGAGPAAALPWVPASSSEINAGWLEAPGRGSAVAAGTRRVLGDIESTQLSCTQMTTQKIPFQAGWADTPSSTCTKIHLSTSVAGKTNTVIPRGGQNRGVSPVCLSDWCQGVRTQERQWSQKRTRRARSSPGSRKGPAEQTELQTVAALPHHAAASASCLPAQAG